jgi:hypothetical protein
MPQGFTLWVSKDQRQADRRFPFSVAKDLKAMRVEAKQNGADRRATFLITPVDAETAEGNLGSDKAGFAFGEPPTLTAKEHYWIDVRLQDAAAAKIKIVGAIYFDSDPAPLMDFDLEHADDRTDVYARTELSTGKVAIGGQSLYIGFFADTADDAKKGKGLRLASVAADKVNRAEADGIVHLSSDNPFPVPPIPPIDRAGPHYAAVTIARGPALIGAFAESFDSACTGGGELAYISRSVVEAVTPLPGCALSPSRVSRIDHE